MIVYVYDWDNSCFPISLPILVAAEYLGAAFNISKVLIKDVLDVDIFSASIFANFNASMVWWCISFKQVFRENTCDDAV